MRYLLDTHTLLFAYFESAKLPAAAIRLLNDLSTECLVSAASVYEIRYKLKLNKLPMAAAFEHDMPRILEEDGYSLLPITADHAARAAAFAADHRDPFDRLLAAQSIADRLPILSADVALDAFGVERRWA